MKALARAATISAASGLWLLFAIAAQAQTATSADTRAIAGCLKTAQDNGGFGGSCIGIVADPCITAASGKNTDVEDWKKCAARELAVWSDLLATAIKGVNGGGFKDIVKAAASAQKSWSDSVKQLCPVFDKIEPGMSMGGANYCRLQETARRVLVLQRLAAAVNEH